MSTTTKSTTDGLTDAEEKSGRTLRGNTRILALSVAVLAGLYHIAIAGFGTPGAFINRSIHLTAVVVLALLYFPARAADTDRVPWYDWLLLAVGVPSTLYIAYAVRFGTLAQRSGSPLPRDLVFGAIAILLVLEITRRATGRALPIIGLAFLAYAYYGRLMPGPLIHRGYDIDRIIAHSYLTTEGIFGIPLGVSATFVVVFIILGAFLEVTGVGDWFIDLAYGATGRSTGGPAKTSVLASGFMASLNGSAVANAATTGAFTIPLMKRSGFQSRYAAAVESAASSGGQIMPPVMGAGAFIMSAWTGISYVTIIAAAAIPALLYFLGVGAAVHFRAKHEGLEGVAASELPNPWELLKTGAHFTIPLIALVWMLVAGYSAMLAAFVAILLTTVVAIPLSAAREFARAVPRGDAETLSRLAGAAGVTIVNALDRGMRMTIVVAAACATAGLVVGVVTLTGLGLKFSSLITTASGGVLIIALILTMITSIILGMGLPTTAAYVVLAALGAPALTALGVELLAAHLFIFYFGIISAITPPIMLAVFTTSSIAESDPWKTGFTAVNLAAAGFLVPYLFVLGPELLLIGETTAIVASVVTAVIGVIALSAGTQGYFYAPAHLVERVALVAGAVALIYPGTTADLVGLAVIAAVFLRQYVTVRRSGPAATPAN
ncbi:TRAP transporter permease [Halalkalicoccus jeotgali]|uniref:TRAP transporter, 4TM/12TM fusion protein n=1 Tax=Halalkalicoccus jeotgali (strain DSM 18796 / CECT 7217 / JCM 14584 / KCTC 4019 / B3) TaxID=795797 RepID=D8J4V8_HALJB|nr:TRAP transporter permease [Halalkalicoccus jeotgali]ADJ15575.1 TRAP transporter, 4TM/12TM fusion protein [Halalkalicoccus jeotgali B3]ELY36017.1 TRAP transporter, 4TM/12TM fusion protein [Halalkalicoccus jeotgali B3]